MSDNTPMIQPDLGSLDRFAIDADHLVMRKKILDKVLKEVMKVDTHYGVIPGTNKRMNLLKPGAEVISAVFQLCPRYNVTLRDLGGGHREYEINCALYTPNGTFVAEGLGTCSTMEAKYRFRKSAASCPECNAEGSIRRSKQEWGGGWYCNKRDGGCGAKFERGDSRIENQEIGRIEHDNPADYWNTILKMGKKRAHIDAVITATGCSDIFTQDLEDSPEGGKPSAAPAEPEPGMGQDGMPTDWGKKDQTKKPASNALASADQMAAIRKAFQDKGIKEQMVLESLNEGNTFGHKLAIMDDMTERDAADMLAWIKAGDMDHFIEPEDHPQAEPASAESPADSGRTKSFMPKADYDKLVGKLAGMSKAQLAAYAAKQEFKLSDPLGMTKREMELELLGRFTTE